MNTLWSADFVLAFIANFLMSFAFYLLMPTLPLYLTGHLQASTATAGMVMSVYVIAALAMRPFSGFLIDSLPRKTLYVVSYALFVALTVAYLGASTVAAFFVVRMLHGLVWSPITTSGNTLAIDIVPSHRRGEGIGYYGMSTNLAMATGPMTGLLLSEHQPFLRVVQTAIASGLLGLTFACFIRAPRKISVPHQALSLDRFLLVKGIAPGVALLFITMAYGVMNTYIGMYGIQHHIPNPGFFFVALAIGIIFSRLLTGRLLDRGRGLQVGLIGASLAMASTLLLGICPVALCYFLAAIIMGLGYGMVFPALQSIIVNLGDHHQRGTANSTYFTACDLGIGLGMLFGGQIAQRSSLSITFLVVSMTTLLGGMLLWAVRRSATQSFNST